MSFLRNCPGQVYVLPIIVGFLLFIGMAIGFHASGYAEFKSQNKNFVKTNCTVVKQSVLPTLCYALCNCTDFCIENVCSDACLQCEKECFSASRTIAYEVFGRRAEITQVLEKTFLNTMEANESLSRNPVGHTYTCFYKKNIVSDIWSAPVNFFNPHAYVFVFYAFAAIFCVILAFFTARDARIVYQQRQLL